MFMLYMIITLVLLCVGIMLDHVSMYCDISILLSARSISIQASRASET